MRVAHTRHVQYKCWWNKAVCDQVTAITNMNLDTGYTEAYRSWGHTSLNWNTEADLGMSSLHLSFPSWEMESLYHILVEGSLEIKWN